MRLSTGPGKRRRPYSDVSVYATEGERKGPSEGSRVGIRNIHTELGSDKFRDGRITYPALTRIPIIGADANCQTAGNKED